MRARRRVSRPFGISLLLAGLLALVLGPASAVEPGTEVRLVDLDPGYHAALRSGEPLYLRIRYRSAVPIHILLSGRYQGDVVRGYRQDSQELFPPGNREATVWLAYPVGVRIDEVEVRVLNANWARVMATALPVDAEWTEASEPGAGAERLTKSWVAALTPAQRERITAILSAPIPVGSLLPFDPIFLWVLGYLLLQPALMFWTSGWWRKAALAPAVIMVPILAYTVLALAARSNLWPLLMLLSAPLACFYLIALTCMLLLSRLARAA